MGAFIIHLCAAKCFHVVRVFHFAESLFAAVLVAVMDVRIISYADTAWFFRHSVHSRIHFGHSSLKSCLHLQSLLPASLVWKQSFALVNTGLLAALSSLGFSCWEGITAEDHGLTLFSLWVSGSQAAPLTSLIFYDNKSGTIQLLTFSATLFKA